MSPQQTLSEPAHTLPDTESLDEFLASVPALAPAARYQLLDQARVLLEGAYVHLRLKRAMHAVDPVQRLRLLERRLEGLSDLQFHAELAAIFRSLRDLHTAYQLPDPYRGHVATLGFLVERYHDGRADEDRYLVTKVDPSLTHGDFGAGAEVLAWNGVPIARAVELNAERQAGSNADARIARGLEALTLRPLRSSPPPDEHWVLIGLRGSGDATSETRIPWRVAPTATSRSGRPQDPVSTAAATFGIDAGTEATRQIRRRLFAPARAQRGEAHALRSVLDSGTRRVAGRSVGYLRIFSFNVSSARRFVEQLAGILAALPPDGLLIDIRGNPGGHIPAAEAALQLVAQRDVVPARFSLSTTSLSLELCQSNPAFARWTESVQTAVETGEAYSQALPLSDPPQLAQGLPRYPGPSVLITDALCYSAADIFAAGYQDNELGRILGTAGSTGAGGANVWTHDLLRLWLPETLQALPEATGFRVALRRTTRVNERIGVPLEDLGVTPTALHRLTRRDITRRNQDLLAAAVRLLDRRPDDGEDDA